MNPPCHRCKKIVYPVDKLSCLDKVWHKACFTCEVCQLKLTMKTYRGYNKLPYCSTHYPSTKFTAVSDTPENRRLAMRVREQSAVVTTASSQSSEYTEVESNNLEFLRHKLINEQASNVNYASKPSQSMRAPAGLSAVPSPPPASVPEAGPAPPPPTTSGPRYIAVHDYCAADEDEISFQEGDHLTEVTIIDDGWGEGHVERTEAFGMFPTNYVKKA